MNTQDFFVTDVGDLCYILRHNEIAIMAQLLRQYEPQVQRMQYVPSHAGRSPVPVGTSVSSGTMQPPPQNGIVDKSLTNKLVLTVIVVGNFRSAVPVVCQVPLLLS